MRAQTGKTALSAISLFSGAGGLDLGIESAGFEVRVAVESDPECAATLRENRDWPVTQRPIEDVPSYELLNTAGLSPGEPDLLIGGPPCQPFSKSGYWADGDTKRLADPRASTIGEFLRVLQDTRPRAFLMENVAGLAYSGKNDGLVLVEQIIEAINQQCKTEYSLNLLLLNAVDFGVPQLRERAFLIGARDGTEFGTVFPTHVQPDECKRDNQVGLALNFPEYRTAWDAIGDIQEPDDPDLALTGKWAALLPSVPEGQNYLFHTDKGGGLPLFGWRRRFWNFLLKLAKELPSWTITATPGPATGPFHWNNRRLSVPELLRLQTFPDGYRVVGHYRSALRQIGNAVPSALAETLGIEIRRRLLHDETADALEPALVLAKKSYTPPPEPVMPVPQEYLHLIGDHEPHPGTGKGYRAMTRSSRHSNGAPST
jgi:DNA (cytosine-5)-methyltransferase 1